jgi:hypothetical protein
LPLTRLGRLGPTCDPTKATSWICKGIVYARLQMRSSDAQLDLGIGIRQQVKITITASDYVVMLNYCTVLHSTWFVSQRAAIIIMWPGANPILLPLVA